ncbi:mediator of RNA polymerase II transcription subunit 25-like isoform X2 [Vigna angularis]|uniref:mediator of RNA polymerase II transcription subunit 25-like isoform X2 n=1 Tax=Phaseolus angularis TaxID=3914 RepID=UPI00080A43C5|nr:mediator of RNA polymerase II transcription subunit 25-like isoform X2 [Vigna angularis]
MKKNTDQGANAQVGLVMYNANNNPGLDVQYIPWTREVDSFLGVLSSLVFNGNNENQQTMVKGLAEALLMFPRPSNFMTTEEYYNGTRHCIVVAARDPIPAKMTVSVPEINQGTTVGTQLYTVNADFYDVAELFSPLAVSLSIISPVQHPCFEVIFNMGNNGSPLETDPISNFRIGQFNVILSRNFREAHVALRGKRTMDPPTNDIRVPIHYANDNQEDLFTIAKMMMSGGRNTEAARDRLETTNPVSLAVSDGFSTPAMFVSNAESSTREGSSEGLVEERGMADQPTSRSSENSLNILPYFALQTLPNITTTTSSSKGFARLPYLAAGFDPYGRPTYEPNGVPPPPITPQFNPIDFWPPQPSSNSLNLVQAWQGTLIAKTHRSRKNLQRGKAHRRVTSPFTLTNEWSSRLEVAFYLPQKALNYTITIFRGPIDYVFFYMLHFNNLDLYEYLMKKNLCAKVNLPFQTLIISPTKNRHFYIGTVFPADVTFVQMN